MSADEQNELLAGTANNPRSNDAALKPIEWSGDLNDDCTAEWNGLMLRAEAMSRTDWWWAVYDMNTNEQVAVSYDAGVRVTNGKKARRAAEMAARERVGRGGDEK